MEVAYFTEKIKRKQLLANIDNVSLLHKRAQN